MFEILKDLSQTSAQYLLKLCRQTKKVSKFFYSRTDAQVNCLKTILKFTLKLTLKQLRHVSVQSLHHQGAH